MAQATRDDETTEGREADEARAPDKPAKLSRGSWLGVLRRTVREFREDNLTDWAAALTYYAILSIFPALLAVVSILGLIGSSATQPLLDNLGSVAPGPAKDILSSALKNLQKNQGAAGILFIVAWPARCGRPPATWRPSCARPTPSTTSARDARSGRRFPPACSRRSCCS